MERSQEVAGTAGLLTVFFGLVETFGVRKHNVSREQFQGSDYPHRVRRRGARWVLTEVNNTYPEAFDFLMVILSVSRPALEGSPRSKGLSTSIYLSNYIHRKESDSQ